MKDIYILGISESHGASAALLKNGKIIGAYNEERFNRQKKYIGYPRNAIHQLLKENKISGKNLEFTVLSFQRAIVTSFENYEPVMYILYRIQQPLLYYSKIFYHVYKIFYQLYLKTANKKLYKIHIKEIAKDLKIASHKIISFPHHLTHAGSVVYGLNQLKRNTLVLTNDGAGDKYCASVITYSNNVFKELSLTENEHSLASLYAHITTYMGMKPFHDEYKIMGLAPYTNPNGYRNKRAYEIVSKLHIVDNLTIKSKIDESLFQYYLEHNLQKYRFDAIAYAIQKVTEEKLCQWVKNTVQYTGINTIYCAGGIFMNVKANKAISELPEVKKLFVMPSAGDESTAIGAAYLGYKKYCEEHNLPVKIKSLASLYLGNSYTNKETETYINKNKLYKKYNITKENNPELIVARLLSKGKIVARFAGRMEFGQRALGNRSILANPSNRNVVRILNDQIKSRDFWMPFAASILDEDEDTYIVNSKHLENYYMILSFDTKPEKRKDIIAAIHPYDYTVRPQVVTKKMNKKYYNLIKTFKKYTGIGAVLNTSFNIHGDPIVCSLNDAFDTFARSGLTYMQIENYLVQKINS